MPVTMTPEQLRRHALEVGARVEHGGSVFNADFTRTPTRPPQIIKQDAPAAPSPDTVLIAQALQSMAESNTRNAGILADAVAACSRPTPEMESAPVAPLPVVRAPVSRWDMRVSWDKNEHLALVNAVSENGVSWNFEIKRDRDEFIESIVATRA